MTDLIKDIINVNILAGKRTLSSIKNLPFIVLSLAIYFLARYFISMLGLYISSIINISFIIGIFNYLVEVIGMSLVMSVLYSVIVGDRLDIKNFSRGWKNFIVPLINTRFIIFIAELLIGRIITYSPLLLMLWSIILNIFLSLMLETIYIGRYEGLSAIVDIFEFLKSNFLQWLPVLIVFYILNISTNTIFASLFGQNIVKLLVQLVLISLLYLYKGYLYSILYNSSVRKRKFQGVFK